MGLVNALDLINRQKAEIERLHIEGLQINKTFMDFVNKQIAEAIKEFAKRLKGKLQWDVEFDNKLVFENDIDNITKEEAEQALHKINHNSLCETETYIGG